MLRFQCCEIGPNQGGGQWYTWECLEKFLFLRYYEDTASTWLVKHFNKLYHYSMIELKGLDVLVPRVSFSPFFGSNGKTKLLRII